MCYKCWCFLLYYRYINVDVPKVLKMSPHFQRWWNKCPSFSEVMGQMSLIFRGDGINVPLFFNPWQNTDMVNAKRFYLLIYSTSFKTFLHSSPWNKLVICKLPFENWYFSYPALGSTLNLGYIKKGNETCSHFKTPRSEMSCFSFFSLSFLLVICSDLGQFVAKHLSNLLNER